MNLDNLSKWTNMSALSLLTVVSVSKHYKYSTGCSGLVQSRCHLHLIKKLLVLTMIMLKHCSLCIEQQSINQSIKMILTIKENFKVNSTVTSFIHYISNCMIKFPIYIT